jgi:hypothetical protein
MQQPPWQTICLPGCGVTPTGKGEAPSKEEHHGLSERQREVQAEEWKLNGIWHFQMGWDLIAWHL